MSVPVLDVNLVGNNVVADGHQLSFDTMLNKTIADANQPTIMTGTGAPTFSAAQGSLYIRIDGGVNSRLYVNSNGSTTWQPISNAA